MCTSSTMLKPEAVVVPAIWLNWISCVVALVAYAAGVAWGARKKGPPRRPPTRQPATARRLARAAGPLAAQVQPCAAASSSTYAHRPGPGLDIAGVPRGGASGPISATPCVLLGGFPRLGGCGALALVALPADRHHNHVHRRVRIITHASSRQPALYEHVHMHAHAHHSAAIAGLGSGLGSRAAGSRPRPPTRRRLGLGPKTNGGARGGK